MRELSDSFMKKLQGEWKPLLEYILSDSELDLQIRDNYINVYYQGGNILKINPRSFYIDEFYFYKDCAKKRKTPLQEEAKSGNVKAKNIIAELVDKRDCLLSPLQSHQLDKSVAAEYFQKAKKIMRDWEKTLNEQLGISHAEKQEQQQIALANRKNTDYVVLDLEYAVSTDPSSSFKYNGSVEDKKRPRFDIIAIHKGQLIVIELKKGLNALEGKSGIEDHIDSYECTIGRDNLGDFLKEMKELLKQKKDLGILDKSLEITNESPKFVFAFADEKSGDTQKYEINSFAYRCYQKGYTDDILYIDKFQKLHKAMSKLFYCQEREKQETLAQKGFFGEARINPKHPCILMGDDYKYNLYVSQQDVDRDYFKKYHIKWWGSAAENKPSGILLSSQIHCLNHLFALREDKNALLSIINNATKMEFDEVLPSLIDDESYLSFEFAYKNDDLIGENDKGARRGYMWTSIDAMIVARKGKDKWLIPIEWKYTETYEKENKTCQKRLDRYEELIKKSDRLKMPENGNIPNSIYFQEPSYELMRQTLLCEQIVGHGYAKNFFHINIIPTKNTELRKAVETEFMPMLTKEAKFKMLDPQELLSPLKGNDKYKDLLTYLETRYWK